MGESIESKSGELWVKVDETASEWEFGSVWWERGREEGSGIWGESIERTGGTEEEGDGAVVDEGDCVVDEGDGAVDEGGGAVVDEGDGVVVAAVVVDDAKVDEVEEGGKEVVVEKGVVVVVGQGMEWLAPQVLLEGREWELQVRRVQSWQMRAMET